MKIVNANQIEKKKNDILDIAEKIIKNSSIEELSIRKIAKELNQAPGIIYHYFENKDAILNALVARGYQEILMVLNQKCTSEDFETQFVFHITAYMKAMIAHKEVFLLLLQSKSEKLQQATSILNADCTQRSSIKQLIERINQGIEKGIFQPIENVEVYAKLLWCSMYGLMNRIILENQSNKEIDFYLNEFIKMMLKLLKGE